MREIAKMLMVTLGRGEIDMLCTAVGWENVQAHLDIF
jgi:hypothetical protein